MGFAQVPAAAVEVEPLSAASAQASHVLLPASVKLNYAVTGTMRGLPINGSSANGDLVWQVGSGHYSATMRARFLGMTLRTRASEGMVTPQGLVPQRFSDTIRAEQHADFHWDTGAVSFSAPNTSEASLRKGAQDQVSVVLQIAAQLAAAPGAYASGTQIAIQTIGPRAAENLVFSIGTQETLDLPMGSINAIAVTRQLRSADDGQLVFWLAPSLGYLPVRIKAIDHDGNVLDQKLRSYDKI